MWKYLLVNPFTALDKYKKAVFKTSPFLGLGLESKLVWIRCTFYKSIKYTGFK